MKCHQCERPAMYFIGEENNIPLCLDCYAKFRRIHDMEFLKNATMMNNALDNMDMVTGFLTPGGRMPVQALARAMQGSHTLNNINISQSQIGVLNTGSIEKIDAAITLSNGSDAELIGAQIKSFTETVIQSEELNAQDKNEVLELTETLAEEVVGRRKPTTINAVMNAISEKLTDFATLAGAAEKLWQVVRPFLPS